MLHTNYYGCCRKFQTTMKNCKVSHLNSTDLNRIQVTTLTPCNIQDKQHYCTAVHRCRSRLIFGGAKDFCPNFPKLARKFWPLFGKYLLMKTFFGMTSKKGLRVLLPTLGAIFARIFRKLPRFSGIFPGFSPNQNFWGCCACTPASYTTVTMTFAGSIRLVSS